jgi:farnesyl diphosphate synthase
VLDLEFEQRAVSGDELLAMVRMKSSALFEAVMIAAALPGLAGAPDAETAVELVRRLARELGEGFQVLDDLLDATGAEPGFGKTPGKDRASGKATAVSVWGAARARAVMNERQALCRRHIGELEGRAGAPARLLRDIIERIFARLPNE